MGVLNCSQPSHTKWNYTQYITGVSVWQTKIFVSGNDGTSGRLRNAVPVKDGRRHDKWFVG